MSHLSFEWDERKSVANVKKHGVSFEEAKSVFVDERAKLIDDPDHSDDEDRFVLLGLSGALRLLLVCHCYRGDGNVIRIISAAQSKCYRVKILPLKGVICAKNTTSLRREKIRMQPNLRSKLPFALMRNQ